MNCFLIVLVSNGKTLQVLSRAINKERISLATPQVPPPNSLAWPLRIIPEQPEESCVPAVYPLTSLGFSFLVYKMGLLGWFLK